MAPAAYGLGDGGGAGGEKGRLRRLPSSGAAGAPSEYGLGDGGGAGGKRGESSRQSCLQVELQWLLRRMGWVMAVAQVAKEERTCR